MSLGGPTALASTFHKYGWLLRQAVFTAQDDNLTRVLAQGWQLCFAFTRLTRGYWTALTESHQVSSRTAVDLQGREWPKGHSDAQWHGGAWSPSRSSLWKCLWKVSPEGVWWGSTELSASEGWPSRLQWKWLRPSCSRFQCDYQGSCCQGPFWGAQTPRELSHGPFGSRLLTLPYDCPVHNPDLQPKNCVSLEDQTSLVLVEQVF